ncbi:hypothetical protein HI914_01999 [Erysiphe necator]|nr:hypothetical protein HI914_01999 [Erysiphe necator]
MMATEKDVQDLLRLLTTGRNKLPMLDAINLIKTLKSTNLHSISAIATTNFASLKNVIPDEKIAKALLTICKKHIKTEDKVTPKRIAKFSSSAAKRHKSMYEIIDQPQTPAELEASLSLPKPSVDEEAISKSVIYTDRTSLLLAFAFQLIKYTMPSQPLSSRLSLGQAVVSFNTDCKVAGSRIKKPNSSQQISLGPKIRIMTSNISVLKRSGYDWKSDETNNESMIGHDKLYCKENNDPSNNVWKISKSITMKKSTFIARSKHISSSSDAKFSLQQLFLENPSLREASHNVSAWRIHIGNSVNEDSNDDGEENGGQYLLDILRNKNINGVLLVVTRWYGGVLLGPDRWRLMSEVSCDCLSQHLQIIGSIGQDALWGIDYQDETKISMIDRAMPIHKPERARDCLLTSFASTTKFGNFKKKKSSADLNYEKEENLSLLLGALDLLFASWVNTLTFDELDRRAWAWYIRMRPSNEGGLIGWSENGEVKLSDILNLRRKG